MARGVNKVILVGNLGNDPEQKAMPNGNPVANITVATSERWKDKQTGQQQEKTEWHRIVFFNRLAEIAGQYLKKGSKVYLEGQLRTRKWQDQSGQDRYTTEIVASEMQMLSSQQDGQQANSQPHQGQYYNNNQQQPNQQQNMGNQKQPYQQPQQQSRNNPNNTQQSYSAPQQNQQQPPVDFDDDIPF